MKRFLVHFVQPDDAFVVQKGPIESPNLIIRTDGREMMGLTVDGDDVICRVDAVRGVTAKEVNLSSIKNLGASAVNDLGKLNASREIAVHPVSVPGFPVQYFFAHKNPSSNDDILGFTEIQFSLKELLTSVNEHNAHLRKENELHAGLEPLDTSRGIGR